MRFRNEKREQKIRTLLSSRESIFGGSISTRRESMCPNWLDLSKYNGTLAVKEHVVSRISTSVPKVRKSIVPKSFPGVGSSSSPMYSIGQDALPVNDREMSLPSNGRKIALKKDMLVKEQHLGADGMKEQHLGADGMKEQHLGADGMKEQHLGADGMKEQHLGAHKMNNTDIARSLPSHISKQPTNQHGAPTCAKTSQVLRVQFKGTFYGNAQPPCALHPVYERPSYSDESDCESLIDDDELDEQDTAWVSELNSALGGYMQKNFSHVDKLPDRRMHASFDQIMEEEAKTARIGESVDQREAAREANRSDRKRPRRMVDNFILHD